MTTSISPSAALTVIEPAFSAGPGQPHSLTATVTATASAQDLSELAERLTFLLQRRVRVDRHRDFDGGMADYLTDDMRGRSKVEQERDARMAKIMESGAGEPGAFADFAPAAAEIVRFHWRAAPGRKDKTVVFPLRQCFGSLGELALTVRGAGQPPGVLRRPSSPGRGLE
jgi:hypothetical protein